MNKITITGGCVGVGASVWLAFQSQAIEVCLKDFEPLQAIAYETRIGERKIYNFEEIFYTQKMALLAIIERRHGDAEEARVELEKEIEAIEALASLARDLP